MLWGDKCWKILSISVTPIEPQRLCGLFTRFLLGELRIATVYGVAPQNAVDIESATPFWEGIRMLVAFILLYILLVALSALSFIALTIFVDDLSFR